MPEEGKKVSVLVPVFNAPELTNRCLRSLEEQLPPVVGEILAFNNGSDATTRDMLDSLRLPRLRCHHNPENLGFGQGVNKGVTLLDSDFVLVINSDTMAEQDFLSPMLGAMLGNPRLGVLIPGGNTFPWIVPERYQVVDGLLPTHHLHGYAFLIRRELFQSIGGFDPVYGLGYFEDTDLGLRLSDAGVEMALHIGVALHHEGAGSFGKNPRARELFKKNEEIFHQRFPGARERVLLVCGQSDLSRLDPDIQEKMAKVFNRGGFVVALAREELSQIPAYELLAGGDTSSLGLMKQLNRGGKNPFKKVTQLWVDRGERIPTPVKIFAQSRGIRVWELA